jgi:hypothetical protein
MPYPASAWRRYLSFITTLILMFSAAAHAQSVSITPVGQLGGSSHAVAVVGNRAYFGMGSRLWVLDVSQPANPVLLGKSSALPGIPLGISVSGNYAYLACTGGFQIVDISNPAAPVRVGGLSYIAGINAYSVTVLGIYAYVGVSGGFLDVYKISNPASPQDWGTFFDDNLSGTGYGVATDGTHLYYADGANGFYILGLTSPTSPNLRGHLNGFARGVAVANNYAYLVGESGLRVVNVSTPTAPVVVGTCNTPGSATAIALAGNYAYVAADSAGLRIIDISNPAAPTLIGGYDTSGSSRNVALAGNYALVADLNRGLQMIDVGVPSAPALTGSYDSPFTDLRSIALGGNYAYVLNATTGLYSVDVSNPASPARVGGYVPATGSGNNVAVHGTNCYLTKSSAGSDIVSVTNPASPTRIASVSTFSNDLAFTVRNNTLFAGLAAGTTGLRFFDVQSPQNGVTAYGLYNSPGSALDVVISGNYAYLADGASGLQVVNATSVSSPVRVGGYDTPGGCSGLTVLGQYCYIADQSSGLQVVNVANPAAPTLSTTVSGSCQKAESQIRYVYVLDQISGLRILDAANPAAPVQVGAYNTGGTAWDLAIRDSYAYISDFDAGLLILQLGLPPGSIQATLNPSQAVAAGVQWRVDSGAWQLSGAIVGGLAPGNHTVEYQNAGEWYGPATELVHVDTSLTTVISRTYVQHGSLQVVLAPDEAIAAGGQWRVDGGAWQNSGATLTDLIVGNHAVEFKSFSGWVSPDPQTVTILNQQTTVLNASYTIPIPMEIVGQFGGFCDAVAVAGNIAYVGAGPSLLVFDISQPSAPIIIDRYLVPDSYIGDIVVDGQYLYVGFNSGLHILDISNPTELQLVSVFEVLGGLAGVNGVAVAGTRAYIAAGGAGLEIIDVSNPASPQHMGVYDTPGSASHVAVSGNYAYIADWTSKQLLIIDVADPANPSLTGSYLDGVSPFGSSILDVTVVGNLAYIAASGSGLKILNVSNPAAPTLLGQYNSSGSSRGVIVQGNRAYVADDTAGLLVIDVTTSSSPALLGTYNSPGYAYNVAVTGNVALLADDAFGLEVINISNPASMAPYAIYKTGGEASDLAISGNHAYMVDFEFGLLNLDISDPTDPFYVGGYHDGSFSYGIDIKGQYAYFTDDQVGLNVLDVSNPASPLLVNSYTPPSYLDNGLTISGNYAYLADGGGMRVMDISNPASPVIVGYLGSIGSIGRIIVEGQYAYVTDSDLNIVDISNPANPVLVGTCNTPGSASDLVISGHYALVADFTKGLAIIDIANPFAPTMVSTYTRAVWPDTIVARGPYAFVGTRGPLQMLDISNPVAPVLRGELPLADTPWRLRIDGDYIYAASFSAGLYIIRAGPVPDDLDADGVLDAADNCPTVFNPDQADGDNNGIGNVCDSPHITAWRSVRTHSGVGALAIVLNASAAGNDVSGPVVETRRDGIQQIEADFDQPVTLVNSAVVSVIGQSTFEGTLQAPVDYSAAAVIGMIDVDTMQITFAPGAIPDETCLAVNLLGSVESGAGMALGGDTDCSIRSLLGDAVNNGTVELGDMLLIKSKISPASNVTIAPECDVNLSGNFTIGDMLLAKSRIVAPTKMALCP